MDRFVSRILASCLLALILSSGTASRADLILTVEDAGVQASTIASVTTENFDGFSTGYFTGPLATKIGSFSASNFINKADQYGGAGGTGGYLAIGYGAGATSTTLTLDGSQSYLGFWWSAADNGNNVDFYSAGQLIGHFDSTTTLASLGSSYYSNPNATFLGQNPSEAYAYVNVFGTDGTTFDSLIFSNTNNGTHFEIDNISVRSTPVDPPYSGTVVNDGVHSVPEPASIAMLSIGAVGTFGMVRRLRRASRLSREIA